MASRRIVLLTLSLTLCLLATNARAEGWSLFGHSQSDREKQQARYQAAPKPGPMKKLGDDLNKLNQGTKKFFTGVGNALTFKKPPSKPQPKKQSWFDSLLGREEPQPVQSLDEFLDLPRSDP